MVSEMLCPYCEQPLEVGFDIEPAIETQSRLVDIERANAALQSELEQARAQERVLRGLLTHAQGADLMTVADIIREYLEREGFGGLCNSPGDDGCGCNGSMPCAGDSFNAVKCQPAYRWGCIECEHVMEECCDDLSGGCYRPERQVRE